MELIKKSFKSQLEQLFTGITMKFDFLASWWWLYEPEKPDILKNK